MIDNLNNDNTFFCELNEFSVSGFRKPQRDLPEYTSDDENVEECALCKEAIDDPIDFGNMFTVGKFKVHLYCCVSVNWPFDLINKYFCIHY